MIKVSTAPADEPVTLAEAKSHLRVTTSDEDTPIQGFIASARDYFEIRTGRTIHQTTYTASFDAWPASKLVLPRATPIISITSITYKDSDGDTSTWDSSKYVFDSYEEPGYVVPATGETWPSFTAHPVNPIVVTYLAGIVTASPLTEAKPSIKQAILSLVGALHENREAETADAVGALVLKYGLDAMLVPHIVDYEC